jgi:hypothetical protein
VGAALRAAVVALLRQQVAIALHEVADRWTAHPAAASVGAPGLGQLPPDLGGRAEGLVAAWTAAVASGTGLPPGSPEVVALTTLALSGTDDAREAGGPDGAATAARRTLDDRGARPTPNDVVVARRDLLSRTDLLFGEEEARLAGVLDRARISPDSTSALRGHLESLERLRRTAFAG